MSKLTRFRTLELDSAALPVRDLTLNPFNVDFIDDANFTGNFLTKAGRAASRWGEISFQTELYGRASTQAVTDALIVESLLEAAGFVATSPGSNRVYTLSTTPNDDKTLVGTLKAFYGDTLGASQINYILNNVAFDCSFIAEAGQIAYFDWKGMGQFGADPADGTSPAAQSTIGNPLRALNGTLTFSADGRPSNLSLAKLQLNLNNELILPNLIGSTYGKGSPEIVNGSPDFEITVVEPSVSTIDFWNVMQQSGDQQVDGQLMSISMRIGNNAKEIVTVAFQGYMRGIPERTDIDGIAYYVIRGKVEIGSTVTITAT